MIVYRLASARYPANDGSGASLFGGRWNHPGVPVIYTAASRALCALEILVNAEQLGWDYLVTPIEIPDAVKILTIARNGLAEGWPVPIAATRTAGTEWVRAGSSAVLAVPSAVVQAERNYLLNPGHPSLRN